MVNRFCSMNSILILHCFHLVQSLQIWKGTFVSICITNHLVAWKKKTKFFTQFWKLDKAQGGQLLCTLFGISGQARVKTGCKMVEIITDGLIMCLGIDPIVWIVSLALPGTWASFEHGSWSSNIWRNNHVCHEGWSSMSCSESESTIHLVNNALSSFKGRRQRFYLLIGGGKIAAEDVRPERTS